MSPYQVKILLAIVFLAAAFTALVTMLEILGRTEIKGNPQTLKKIHQSAGFLFAACLLPLIWIGGKFVAQGGDNLPLRGVLHAVLASFLIVLFLLKLAVVRRYKQFLKHVPVMGMTIFVLAVVVFGISAGFYALTQGSGQAKAKPSKTAAELIPEGDAEKGAALFASKCASCHRHDADAADYAPGLKGILKKPALPSSGRAATAENIRAQFLKPMAKMPSFAALSEKETADIIAYLKTI